MEPTTPKTTNDWISFIKDMTKILEKGYGGFLFLSNDGDVHLGTL
jgi:hypothetical protein